MRHSLAVEGKTVVVTGASSGVGRATARAFGARHAHVGLIARNSDALDAAVAEIERLGGKALALPLDVADADAVDQAASKMEERFGPIDIWVNCAMVTVFSPVMQMTAEEYHRVTEVTYLGYVHGTLAALHRMAPRNEGTIIQIGSALAYRSIPLQSAYCAAKAAIRGFTDSLRTELLHDGSNIHLSMLQLPAVNTPQFVVQRNKLDHRAQPVPPIYTPAMIADAVVWAAEHHPREMLISGSTLEAVYGQKLAPGILDRYLAATCYESQQTQQPEDRNRPDNLFEPVPGDHGADGPFGEKARSRDIQLWLRTHSRNVALLAGAGAAGLGAMAAIARLHVAKAA